LNINLWFFFTFLWFIIHIFLYRIAWLVISWAFIFLILALFFLENFIAD
jgi:hypothetical protein